MRQRAARTGEEKIMSIMPMYERREGADGKPVFIQVVGPVPMNKLDTLKYRGIKIVGTVIACIILAKIALVVGFLLIVANNPDKKGGRVDSPTTNPYYQKK